MFCKSLSWLDDCLPRIDASREDDDEDDDDEDDVDGWFSFCSSLLDRTLKNEKYKLI